MSTLADLNLNQNPFRDITPNPEIRSDDPIVWGDMVNVKDNIQHVYDNTINTTPRQIILNWGQYGGGKTFSAYYFIKKFNDKTIDNVNLHHAYIRNPKEGNQATKQLFRNIVDFLSLSKITDQVKNLFDALGEQKFFNFINNKINSEEFSKAIMLLASRDEDIKSIMSRYIFSGVTKTELKKLGIARTLDSNIDQIKFLTGIISCFLGDYNHYSGKFIVWIDEMEDLVYYSSKDYKMFSQALRDLFDSLNNNFTVFMNFTLAEPQESTIELLLGGALWSRINRKIRFQELNMDDVLIYCQDLLNSCSIQQREAYYPFTEDILKALIQLIPKGQVTPREINKNCKGIIDITLQKNLTSISMVEVQDWALKLQEDN